MKSASLISTDNSIAGRAMVVGWQMTLKNSWLAGAALVLLQLLAGSPRVSAAPTAMIFCNGGMGNASGLTASQISGLRASGMTTMIIFNMGVANSLTLSWPDDHIGWRLQVQTNELTVGLGTNWLDVVGATATNQMSFPIDPESGGVFYRMVYP